MVKRSILNIAHRGARSIAPENTMAAARAALAVGADMWETDVGVTRDDVLILFHDDSLARTTDATKVFPDRSPWSFTDFSYRELLRLDAGSWFIQTDPFNQIRSGKVSNATIADYPGEKIPTLEEALIYTRDTGWRINIELKRLPASMGDFPIVERVLALIDRLQIATQYFVISSFNHDWLKQVRTLRPDIEVQALMGYSKVKPIIWEPIEFAIYNARHTLVNASKVAELTGKGLVINVWPVNEKKAMQRFIRSGAAGIITDFPQRLDRLLNSRNGTL